MKKKHRINHVIGAFAVSMCALLAGATTVTAPAQPSPIFPITTHAVENAKTVVETEPEITTTPAISYKAEIEDISDLLPLPSVDTSIKFFTDYRCYSNEGTPHNRLQAVCYTDENGFRRFNDDYVVALGSFYSTAIGDRFRVRLDSGVGFTVIVGDGKADCDTDVNNMYTPCVNYDGESVGNMLEFIIDEEFLPVEIYAYGSLDYYDFMKGSVTEFEYLGRDNSGDWTSYF